MVFGGLRVVKNVLHLDQAEKLVPGNLMHTYLILSYDLLKKLEFLSHSLLVPSLIDIPDQLL